ncbi:MAG TPA: HD domain-containing phosphohydrolase [Fimbriimonadaceae bacterium]|nr:HD domain-containing phosphohydrolase [Fimbriimonadaceae bacterium]
MHLVTLVVLLAASAATISLALYVFVYLPRVAEKKYREAMLAFSTAVELRFPSHRGLSDRVSRLSVAVGMELGLSRKRLLDLELAATLRDIGLCSVPYALMNERPRQTWSAEELRTYDRHGEVSGAMLELVPRLAHLAPIVRNHHTEFASAEPVSGVLRSQIPLEAFILSAVTEYVRSANLQGQLLARETLSMEAGTKHDPRVVQALLRVLPSVRVGSAYTEEAVRA